MKTIVKYAGLLLVILVLIILNWFILGKWTNEYDNHAAGGWAIPFLGFSSFIINGIFFLVFLIAGIVEKKNRILYFMVALLAVIAVGILIFTG